MSQHSRLPSGLRIHADNEIPFGRGLGSSGAAVIAGVLLGNQLGGLKLPTERLLDFALMVERHQTMSQQPWWEGLSGPIYGS